MIVKPSQLFLFFFSFFFLASCTIVKDDRLLKKNTKEWRASKSVLHAYADSPMAGNFLELRANGKFEQTSSGMLKSFSAGNYTISQDTITLIYFNSQLDSISTHKAVLNRGKNLLLFEGEEAWNSMRVLSSEL